MSLTTIVDSHTTDGSIVAPTDQVDRALQAIVAKPKRASKKQKKDPNAPKRPMGPYMLWLADNRASIREEHFPNKNDDGKHIYPEGHPKAGAIIAISAVASKAGEIWKTLNDEEKAPYFQKAEELRTEYRLKMKDYTPDPEFLVAKPKKTKGPMYDPEEIPQPTEGWTGPFEMKYLKNKVVDADGKTVRIIKNFTDAVQKAQNLNAAWDSAKTEDDFPTSWSKDSKPCGGITKTKTGYDLRLGNDLLTTDPKHRSTGRASWIFGEYQPPVPTKTYTEHDFEANTISPQPEAEPQPKPEAEPQPEADPQPETKHQSEPETDNKPEPKKPKKLVRRKKPTSKYPSAELEEIEIEKDGEDVPLFLHEDSGEVFDKANLLEPIGKVDGEGELVFF